MAKESKFTGDFGLLALRLGFFLMLLAMCAEQAIASTAGVFQFVVGDVRVVLAAGS